MPTPWRDVIAQIARYLHTPLPMVEEMLGDDIIAYHASAMRLLEAENPKK